MWESGGRMGGKHVRLSGFLDLGVHIRYDISITRQICPISLLQSMTFAIVIL